MKTNQIFVLIQVLGSLHLVILALLQTYSYGGLVEHVKGTVLGNNALNFFLLPSGWVILAGVFLALFSDMRLKWVGSTMTSLGIALSYAVLLAVAS